MSNDVRQRLMQQIREWNINRLDLFALSEPNQVLDVPKGRRIEIFKYDLNTSEHYEHD